MAPLVILAASTALWVVIPFGPDTIVQNLNIGLSYIAAVTGINVLAFLMAGWSSNNKWSLIGSLRSAAQLVSYEVPLVLSLVAVGMMAGTLRLGDIVAAQQGGIGNWFIFPQIIGFVVFFIAGLAEANRAPFDLPEAESELVAGYNTEYSGFRWAVFFLAEYANLIVFSALTVTFFSADRRVRCSRPSSGFSSRRTRYFRRHVDPVDAAPYPHRPLDEFGLVCPHPVGIAQFGLDRIVRIVARMMTAGVARCSSPDKVRRPSNERLVGVFSTGCERFHRHGHYVPQHGESQP